MEVHWNGLYVDYSVRDLDLRDTWPEQRDADVVGRELRHRTHDAPRDRDQRRFSANADRGRTRRGRCFPSLSVSARRAAGGRRRLLAVSRVPHRDGADHRLQCENGGASRCDDRGAVPVGEPKGVGDGRRRGADVCVGGGLVRVRRPRDRTAVLRVRLALLDGVGVLREVPAALLSEAACAARVQRRHERGARCLAGAGAARPRRCGARPSALALLTTPAHS